MTTPSRRSGKAKRRECYAYMFIGDTYMRCNLLANHEGHHRSEHEGKVLLWYIPILAKCRKRRKK